MATLTERLAVIIDAKTGGAVGELRKVGGAAEDLDRKTSKTDRALQKMGIAGTVSGAQLKAGVATGAAAAGAALVAFVYQSRDAASALNEQISATNTIFKGAADQVLDFGDTAATELGISERAALQAANQFGDLFLKLGYSGDAAATFSEDLVRMSADFASFKDLAPEEVLEKLRAGLAGESEPLRSLGIFLNEAKVQAKGMELGLADATGQLDEGGKVAARYALIMEGMGEAQGDVARTSDSAANQTRQFNAQMEDLQATVGNLALPAITEFTSTVNEMLGPLTSGVDALSGMSDKVNVVGEVASAGLGPLGLLTGIFGDNKEGADKAAEAEDYLADSAEKLGDRTRDVTARLKEQAAATEEAEDATREMIDATVASFSSEIAHEQAINRVADAQVDLKDKQRALTEAINIHGKKSREAFDAANALRDAEIGLRDATLGAAGAAARVADDQAKAAGTALNAEQKTLAYRNQLIALRDQAAPGSPLRANLDGLISRLDDAGRERHTTIFANTRPAYDSVQELIRWIYRQEASIRVYGGRIAGVTGVGGLTRADGGWVHGPGGPREDRVPLWASNGEYVVNAASAQRHGPLLEAINAGKFANGGWVGGGSTDARTFSGDTYNIVLGPGTAREQALAFRAELLKMKRSGMKVDLA